MSLLEPEVTLFIARELSIYHKYVQWSTPVTFLWHFFFCDEYINLGSHPTSLSQCLKNILYYDHSSSSTTTDNNDKLGMDRKTLQRFKRDSNLEQLKVR